MHKTEKLNVKLWINRGDYYQEQGNLQEAITCFQNAITLEDTCEEAWFKKGKCLELLGDHENARHCFNQANDIELLKLQDEYHQKDNKSEKRIKDLVWQFLLRNPLFYLMILAVPGGVLLMIKGGRVGLETMGEFGTGWFIGGLLLMFGMPLVLLASIFLLAFKK